MCLLLFAVLTVAGSAAVITPAQGYSAYPILCNENVRFYVIEIDEEGEPTGYEEEILLPDALKLTNGQLFGDGAELQVWFPLGSNHLSEFKLLSSYDVLLSQGVAVLDSMVTEITFTGTAIRLGTCYRNVAAENDASNTVRVEIDGQEYPMIEGALTPTGANDTTPTIFFEANGLEDKAHTVRIYNAEEQFSGTRLNFDFYEIIGTDPSTGEYQPPDAPAGTNPPATEPKPVDSKPADTTAAPSGSSAGTTEAAGTASGVSGETEEGSFPVWIPIVIAAVVVAIIVVTVVVKKKK